MKQYKITIAYDGTDFSGWQVQPTSPTIASTLQNSFQKLFHENISLLGASRTDSGVHALGQIARFSSHINISCERMKFAWNNVLPKSIHIRILEEVDKSFHPHKNVFQKTYYYHLFYHKPLPFFARYGWYHKYSETIDWQKFLAILSLYEGTHDFASFCKVDTGENIVTIRTIDAIKTENLKRYNCLRVIIKGKGFARFQIRRMIGYAFDVARRNDLSIDYIRDLLHIPNAQQTLLKADACGLMLRKIVYR